MVISPIMVLLLTVSGGPPGGPGRALSWRRFGVSGAPGALTSDVERDGETTAAGVLAAGGGGPEGAFDGLSGWGGGWVWTFAGNKHTANCLNKEVSKLLRTFELDIDLHKHKTKTPSKCEQRIGSWSLYTVGHSNPTQGGGSNTFSSSYKARDPIGGYRLPVNDNKSNFSYCLLAPQS